MRRQLVLAAADAAVTACAAYRNDHRLHGAFGWLTPAERFDGTPFTGHPVLGVGVVSSSPQTVRGSNDLAIRISDGA